MARDIQLTADGDIPPSATWVTGDELIVQRIRIRLRTWLGEWLLDRAQGMQYERLFMQKPPRVTEFAALVRREVEAVPGVAAVRSLVATFRPETQAIEITGRVELDDAERTIAIRLGTAEFGVEFVGL